MSEAYVYGVIHITDGGVEAPVEHLTRDSAEADIAVCKRQGFRCHLVRALRGPWERVPSTDSAFPVVAASCGGGDLFVLFDNGTCADVAPSEVTCDQ